MQILRLDSLPVGSELHGYRIEQVLGSGAFGITYLARHQYLSSLHVIKEYLPDCAMREHSRSTVSPKSSSDRDLFDWGLKSFYKEAQLLHQLSHPHIVKVTDLFEANGTAYFVMPYLRGYTLHEWMKNNPRPSQEELETIFVPLLEGLKYIHEKGLLHRDVKPENIYITDNTNPILIDFGSARMAIGQKSKALTQILTPHFAPIEQYASKGTYTPAMDLYGFAGCMYQAITGDLPEEAPNRLTEDEQPRLVGSEYEKRYAGHFLQAIDKSLSVHARERHQDGFELQKDLVMAIAALDISCLNGTAQEDDFLFDEEADEEPNFHFEIKKSSQCKQSFKTGSIWNEPYTGMEFVWVPGGCFQMGNVYKNGRNDELHVHEVCLDGFFLGKYPVTQIQWEKVMGSNPSRFKGPNNPVEQVSFNDVLIFIKLLNHESPTNGFRLPTEAEWEYACRGCGIQDQYYGSSNIDSVAWHSDNSDYKTHAVGGKLPNALGLYDMNGNVCEWISDWYDSNYYAKSPKENPQGPSFGRYKMFRGGSWNYEPKSCNATTRFWFENSPRFMFISIGFRLANSQVSSYLRG